MDKEIHPFINVRMLASGSEETNYTKLTRVDQTNRAVARVINT
jgi:hypothetical protein